MKDKVFIKIKGLSLSKQGEPANESISLAQDETFAAETEDMEEDSVETISVGSYKVVNGKECIHFEECYDGETEKSSNIIKFTENEVQVSKKGAITAHMDFKRGEKTMTFYETPFGNIYLGIFTRDIRIERSVDEIRISIEYALEVNYEQLNECRVSISISSNFEI
ncbi:MAG: DUF1934 domain-containing protein [Lachnospira sp.]